MQIVSSTNSKSIIVILYKIYRHSYTNAFDCLINYIHSFILFLSPNSFFVILLNYWKERGKKFYI